LTSIYWCGNYTLSDSYCKMSGSKQRRSHALLAARNDDEDDVRRSRILASLGLSPKLEPIPCVYDADDDDDDSFFGVFDDCPDEDDFTFIKEYSPELFIDSIYTNDCDEDVLHFASIGQIELDEFIGPIVEDPLANNFESLYQQAEVIPFQSEFKEIFISITKPGYSILFGDTLFDHCSVGSLCVKKNWWIPGITSISSRLKSMPYLVAYYDSEVTFKYSGVGLKSKINQLLFSWPYVRVGLDLGTCGPFKIRFPKSTNMTYRLAVLPHKLGVGKYNIAEKMVVLNWLRTMRGDVHSEDEQAVSYIMMRLRADIEATSYYKHLKSIYENGDSILFSRAVKGFLFYVFKNNCPLSYVWHVKQIIKT